MNDTERAKNAVYELYNVAEHVDSGSQGARRRLDEGDVPGALECLEQVARSAQLFDMRWRDALEAVRNAVHLEQEGQ